MYRNAANFDGFGYASGFGLNTASSKGAARTIRVRPIDREARISMASGRREAVVTSLASARVGTIPHTLAELRRYSRFDGAVSESFDAAEAFFDLVRHLVGNAKAYVQYFDGNAVLNFRKGEVNTQFEFLPDGTIATNIDIGDDEWDDDVEGFDKKSLPAAIADRLSVAEMA